MKKRIFLLVVALLAIGQSAFAYDFSAVSPSGHMLFYKIIDPINHYVKLTYPNSEINENSRVWEEQTSFTLWTPYNRPTGAVVIPDTVSFNGTIYTVRSIGNFTFYGCPITSVVMPNTIDTVYTGVFWTCSSLTNVTFSNSLRYIGSDAFHDCMLGDVILPPSVRNLGYGAFVNAHITNITLNDSIQILQSACLLDNPLSYLHIPASVEQIGDYVLGIDLGHPSTTSLTVDPNNPYYDSRNNCNAVIRKSNNELIIGCKNTSIPEGVNKINLYAFTGCNIETLVIPSSIVEMDFGWCHINKLALNAPVIGIGSWNNGTWNTFDTIQILNENPPIYRVDYMEDVDYAKPIIVPCNTLSTYQSADFWSNFTNMREYEAPQITVNAENGTATVLTYPTCTSDTATVSATADSNYHFVRWSDGSTQNPYTLVLNGNTTLTANFAIDSMTVTAAPANPYKGTVIGGDVVPYGGTATVTAIPMGGNIFLCWSNGVTANPYTLTVTSDTTLKANFTLPDTLIIRDTVNHYVHDTSFVHTYVHDTMIQYINHYIYDTAYVNNNIHDTVIQYLNHYIYDTTYVNNNIHDTLVQYVNHYIYDTTYVNNNIHDTLVQYVNQYIHDTTHVYNYVYDTVKMTTQMFDTTIVNNYQFDTAIYNRYTYDTAFVTNLYYDTVYVHIHDTIYITGEGIDGVETMNAKVYSSQGQVVVEGAEGNIVTLYDVNGRVLATKQDYYTTLRFDVPVSGAYLIRIGKYPARKVVVIR